MTEQHKYSIIVPVYNAESSICRCIDSILAQSYSNFELILVDDGSQDRSGVIIDEYASKDSRIIVIHKSNGGVSSARNVGLHCAKGELITFVDSDDYIEKDFLKILYYPDYDLTICGYQYFGGEDRFLKPDAKVLIGSNHIADEINNKIANNYFRVPWGKVLRASIIKNKQLKFDEQMKLGEDTLFIISYCSLINSIKFIDYIGYNYYAPIVSHNYIINAEIYRYSIQRIEEAINKIKHNDNNMAYSINWMRMLIYHYYFSSLFKLSKRELRLNAFAFIRNRCYYYLPNNLLYKIRKSIVILFFELLYRKPIT